MKRPTWSSVHAVGAQAFGKGLAVVAWTALLSLAGRGFDGTTYGHFMLATNAAMLAVIVGCFGQPQTLLYLSGRLGTSVRSARHHGHWRSCAIVMSLSSLVASVGLAAFLHSFERHALPIGLALACALWVLGSCWQALMAEEGKTVSRMWRAGLFANTGAAGGAIALTAALAVLGTVTLVGGRMTLGLALATLGVASAACACGLLWSYLGDRHRQAADGIAVIGQPAQLSVVKAGLLLTLNHALAYVMTLTDIWWAARWQGAEASGSYATAAYLARFCSLSSILLSAAYSARFAALLAAGEVTVLSRLVRRMAWLSALAGLFVLATLLGAAATGWLGSAFNLDAPNSVTAMLTLGMGHTIGSFFGFGPMLLAAAGRFKDLSLLTALGAGVTVVLAGPATHWGGLTGLATVFAVVYALFTMTCHYRTTRLLGKELRLLRPHRAELSHE